MTLVAAAIIAYLIGSVSFAVLVSRAFGLPDPRSYGSGNPGATNVLRSGRKSAAALTLVGDALKGWFAVTVVEQHVIAEPAAAGVAAVAVILGHMYPVFHRFHGGKGISTALGVLVALNLWLAGAAAASWIIIAAFFRLASLASLVATACAASMSFLLYGWSEVTGAVLIAAALIFWRHRTNIRNLLAGTESRIGGGSAGAAPG